MREKSSTVVRPDQPGPAEHRQASGVSRIQQFWIVVPATTITDDRDLALLGPGGSGAGNIAESRDHAKSAF